MDLEALRRHSRIRLRDDGVFLHDGEPIANPRIQRAFHRGVRVQDDGEVTLHVGTQWCYLDVDDVPFFVVGVRFEPPSGAPLRAVHLRLADGGVEPLDPATLALAPDGALYCRVHNGRHRARLLRAAYHAIADRFEPSPDSPVGVGLRLAGRLHPVRALTTEPGAA